MEDVDTSSSSANIFSARDIIVTQIVVRSVGAFANSKVTNIYSAYDIVITVSIVRNVEAVSVLAVVVSALEVNFLFRRSQLP